MDGKKTPRKASKEKMAYSNQWTSEHYKRLSVLVTNGERDVIRKHIEKLKEKDPSDTMGKFVRRAIWAQMERDNAEDTKE